MPTPAARGTALPSFLLPAAGPKPGRIGKYAERAESEAILLSLYLDRRGGGETLQAFPVRDGVLLPLGEICRLLGLAVLVDPPNGTASGFIISQDRTFLLDVPGNRATVSGKAVPYDRSKIEVHADDIYVDGRLLAAWLPIRLTVDPRAALLLVEALEPLPVQTAAVREKQGGNLSFGLRKAESYPRISLPYRGFEFGAVDQTFQVQTHHDAGADRQRWDAASSTYLSGDLLWMDTTLYFDWRSPGGQTDFRGTAGRKDPAGGLLGPLRAKEFLLGEVVVPTFNLVSQGQAGTGLMVSNFPLATESQVDRRSFRGFLPPGWQVELYWNDNLLAFQTARPDGQYEFLDVPSYLGPNDFRLVFYGPQGQRREESIRSDSDQVLAAPGEFRYRVVGADPKGFISARTQLETVIGLPGRVNLQGGYFRISDWDAQDGRGRRPHAYGSAGFLGQWSWTTATLTAVKESGGGSAFETSFRNRFGPVTATFRHAQLQDGFTSEFFSSAFGLVKRRSELDLFATLPGLSRPWFSTGLKLQRNDLANGRRLDIYTHRIYSSIGGWYLSNNLQWNKDYGFEPGFRAANSGQFMLSRFYRNLGVRAQASYRFDGARRLNSFGVAADSRAMKGLFLTGSLNRMVESRDTAASISLNKFEGLYALGLNLEYSRQNRFSASLSFHVAFGRDNRDGAWWAQAQPAYSMGTLSALAFVDLNCNGIRDADEPPAPGLKLVSTVGVTEVTDGRGMALIKQLPAYVETGLSVDTASMEDPFQKPSQPGYAILSRPGKNAILDVAIRQLAEIAGTAHRKFGNRSEAFKGLLVEIVDGSGKVLKRTRAAFDGYFNFSGIPAGASYTLRVAPEEVVRLQLGHPEPRTIAVPREGGYVDGQDLAVNLGSGSGAGESWLELLGDTPAPVPAVPDPGAAAAPRPEPGSGSLLRAPSLPPQEHASRSALDLRDPASSGGRGAAQPASGLEGYTLRLVVASRAETVRAGTETMRGRGLEVFTRPLTLKNGQAVTQLFAGRFPSRAAAEYYVKQLPSEFRGEGGPIVFCIREIPARQ
ncbi:MAG: hypothetical protein IPL96_15730 [Holophagaceae bacterium]|nr:hypothetical protein [Holophagaceae bacterium]